MLVLNASYFGALYEDICLHEAEVTPTSTKPFAYAVMHSTLAGPYVVKYVIAHRGEEPYKADRAKQEMERALLAEIAKKPELQSVCQSLAPDHVMQAIVDGVRAVARMEEPANAAPFISARDFPRRLTISANLLLDGFQELKKLSELDMWTRAVIHRLVADALILLHVHGIYQGDMHKGNVLYKLSRDGVAQIRVIDFDLGFLIPPSKRNLPLGGNTVVAHRNAYGIKYSFPNYMYTEPTRSYAANADQMNELSRSQYLIAARGTAMLRGVMPLEDDAREPPRLFDILPVDNWQVATTWPSSVRGVVTYITEHTRMTWVMRVVTHIHDDFDEDLFAHEIRSALTQPPSSAIRGVAVEITSADSETLKRKFQLAPEIPSDLAYGCVLVLRVAGKVQTGMGESSTVLVNDVPVHADMARVFPKLVPRPRHAQFQKVYIAPLRVKLNMVDLKRKIATLRLQRACRDDSRPRRHCKKARMDSESARN
jgi:hypothetical protein